jgi:hypothetical protein
MNSDDTNLKQRALNTNRIGITAKFKTVLFCWNDVYMRNVYASSVVTADTPYVNLSIFTASVLNNFCTPFTQI